MTYISDSAISKARIALGVSLAVLGALTTSALLYYAVPSLTAAISLFPLYSEQVGIDVYGAVFPILLSIGFLFVIIRSRNTVMRKILFQDRFFWALVLILTLVALALFGLVQTTSGALTLPPVLAAGFATFGAFVGIGYGWKRQNIPVVGRACELYACGVFAMFFSDLVRTFTGWSQAPGQALVWGAGGTHDLVLWFGFYLAFSNAAYDVVITKLAGRLLPTNRPRGQY